MEDMIEEGVLMRKYASVGAKSDGDVMRMIFGEMGRRE